MLKKKIFVTAAAAALICALPVFRWDSWADETASGKQTAAEGTQKESGSLRDNVMEYGELGGLIKEYNPAIASAYRTQIDYRLDDAVNSKNEFKEIVDDYQMQIDELKEQRRELLATAKAQNQQNNPVIQETVRQIDSGIAGLEAAKKQVQRLVKGYGKAENTLEDQDSYANRMMQTQVDALTVYAQMMMIGYDNLAAQQTSLEKMRDLSAQSYQAALAMAGQGMATEADVLSAKKDMAAAESSLQAIRQSAESARRKLCSLVGWSPDGKSLIAHVPTAPLEEIAAMDLESDMEKAIANNQTLASLRHSGSGGATFGVEEKRRGIEDATQRLSAEMERLHQDVMGKKTLYDSAATSYEKAKLQKEAADIQYQMGMISKLQYLGAESQFAAAEGSRKSADTALLQAVETYRWAVKGQLTIPE